MSDFRPGDMVLKKSGAPGYPAEVRAVFSSRRGRPMLVVEYEKDIFRVYRAQQTIKVERKGESQDLH